MFTSGCAQAFPDENEYPARFPIASILPHTKDLYEHLTGALYYSEEQIWENWRKTTSKSMEQVAVLLAMAQDQAHVLDTNRFDNNNDSRLHVFEVQPLFKLLH